MKTRLDQIEARLQSLIEGSASFLMRGNLEQRLAHQLVAAVQDSIINEPDGHMIAPGEYTISLHPELEAYWKAHFVELENVARSLQEVAREYGILFASEPELLLTANPQLQPDEVQVKASGRSSSEGQTSVFPPQRGELARNDIPHNAFLIVDGKKVFPLNHNVINIGRRSDNHLVLPDPRVSRVHAQIRAVRGQYILFDLNSSGGTLVNGQRIHQYTLKPGDVISLSGVSLIYGEDPNPDLESDDTGNTRTLNTKNQPPEVLE